MRRIILDGMAIRPGGRGVARVLKQVLPLLARRTDDTEYVIVTSDEGRAVLPASLDVTIAPLMPMSIWEQFGLPEYARRLGGTAVYSYAECGPIWGPPVIMNVPEDPHVRWAFSPVDTRKELLRRAYQRFAMRRSVLRSPVVITSSHAVATQLVDRFGRDLPPTEVVPLGVDTSIFYPDQTEPSEDAVFHIGGEARDQSVLVVQAYARALQLGADLPELALAGNLGPFAKRVHEEARRLKVENRVHLLGRVSDEELRRYYANAALCVQPSIYEGFGLQPLEALACGAALIVSAEPAVEEVVQDAAAIVPQQEGWEHLSTKMATLWSDGTYRRSLRDKALHRSRDYSWETTADTLHTTLQSLPIPPRHKYQLTISRSSLIPRSLFPMRPEAEETPKPTAHSTLEPSTQPSQGQDFSVELDQNRSAPLQWEGMP